MGTETSKIAFNAHVHLRTANQQMSRPELMWTTSLTSAEVAGFVRTLPVGVHSARRQGCLRSLMMTMTTTLTTIPFSGDRNSVTPTTRRFLVKSEKKAVRSEHPHPGVFKYLRYLILLYKSEFFCRIYKVGKKK